MNRRPHRVVECEERQRRAPKPRWLIGWFRGSQARTSTTGRTGSTLLPMTLQVSDQNRVRTITLDRPEALNAFNEALYDATTEALHAAAEDPAVAVVLLTGNGRGFSAG